MALQTNDVIQGATAVVRMNGVIVAYATGISSDIAVNAVQVKVLGSVITQQIVHTGIDVSFSVETFRLFSNSALVQQLFPRGSTTDVLNFPYLDFEIVELASGTPIARYLKAKPTRMSNPFSRDSVMGQNLTFVACTYSDETPLAIEAAVQ